jgi:hypothetical protein
VLRGEINRWRDLPHVWIFDNDDLRTQFRHVAVLENGQRVKLNEPMPGWLFVSFVVR